MLRGNTIPSEAGRASASKILFVWQISLDLMCKENIFIELHWDLHNLSLFTLGYEFVI